MILTTEQRAAVTCDSNTLVEACPGSGKTRSIVAKILRCLDDVRNTPRKIAVITYTNAAVYEIESRMRELKRVTAPADSTSREQNKQPKNNDTSGEPEQRQERNYSQGENQPALASLPNVPPVGTATTYRRIS